MIRWHQKQDGCVPNLLPDPPIVEGSFEQRFCSRSPIVPVNENQSGRRRADGHERSDGQSWQKLDSADCADQEEWDRQCKDQQEEGQWRSALHSSFRRSDRSSHA